MRLCYTTTPSSAEHAQLAAADGEPWLGVAKTLPHHYRESRQSLDFAAILPVEASFEVRQRDTRALALEVSHSLHLSLRLSLHLHCLTSLVCSWLVGSPTHRAVWTCSACAARHTSRLRGTAGDSHWQGPGVPCPSLALHGHCALQQALPGALPRHRQHMPQRAPGPCSLTTGESHAAATGRSPASWCEASLNMAPTVSRTTTRRSSWWMPAKATSCCQGAKQWTWSLVTCTA